MKLDATHPVSLAIRLGHRLAHSTACLHHGYRIVYCLTRRPVPKDTTADLPRTLHLLEAATRAEPMLLELFHRPARLTFGRRGTADLGPNRTMSSRRGAHNRVHLSFVTSGSLVIPLFCFCDRSILLAHVGLLQSREMAS